MLTLGIKIFQTQIEKEKNRTDEKLLLKTKNKF